MRKYAMCAHCGPSLDEGGRCAECGASICAECAIAKIKSLLDMEDCDCEGESGKHRERGFKPPAPRCLVCHHKEKHE